jgi:hypothetical protein
VAAALITVLLGVWGVLLLLPAEEPGRVGLTVDPAKLVFGSQPLQQSSAPQQVTVTNDGGSAAGPPELTSTGTHPGDFVVDGEDCSASLPPGRSCALIVVFQPTGTGHRQALLEIGLSGQEPVPVELTGDGASDEPPAPRIDESDPRIDEPDPERSAADVVPRSLAFGPVPEGTRSREQAVTVSSVGTDDLPLRAAALGGAHPADFEITDQSCTGELAPGDACRLTVVFAPTAVGERAATVTLAPDVRISLTGVGTAPADTEPPEITVSDVSVGTLSAAEDVEYEVSALDEVDGSVPVVCDPESGSAFPVGVTEVTCRATDDSGNEAEATFTVTVTEGQVE